MMMAKDNMHEQKIKEFKALPDRKNLELDLDILYNNKITEEVDNDEKTEYDPLKKKLPAKIIKF